MVVEPFAFKTRSSAISSVFIGAKAGAWFKVTPPERFIADPDSVNTLVTGVVFENRIVPIDAFAMLFVELKSVEPLKTRFVVPLDDGATPPDQLLPMFQSAVPLVPTQVVWA